MKSRRQVLRVVAGAAVLPVLPSNAVSYSPKVLHADEMRLLSVLVDLIIPRTNTPGANDAGVPVWIDEALSADVALRSRFRNGLNWLNAEARNRFRVPFTGLSEHDQASLL